MLQFVEALSCSPFSNLKIVDLKGSCNIDSNQTLEAYARVTENSMTLKEFKMGALCGNNMLVSGHIMPDNKNPEKGGTLTFYNRTLDEIIMVYPIKKGKQVAANRKRWD